MNRQRIRVIALAALLVAGGAYFWAQQTATSVKPAVTGNAGQKQAAAPAAAKTPAAPAAAKTPAAKPASATAPASGTSQAKPPAAAQAKSAAPPSASSKTAPAPAPPAAAAAPRTTALPAAVPAALVEPAAWQDHLQKGAFLAEEIRPRLPQGTDLIAASAGFRDLQQFVASVAAAHNLGLGFDELKRRVVTDRKGLASAIEAMKKVASPTIEEQRAEYEARGLIQEAKRHPLPAPSGVKAVSGKPDAKKPVRAQSGA